MTNSEKHLFSNLDSNVTKCNIALETNQSETKMTLKVELLEAKRFPANNICHTENKIGHDGDESTLAFQSWTNEALKQTFVVFVILNEY